MSEGVYREELVKLIGAVELDVTAGAEVGVHKGKTSALLLDRFKRLRLVMVDMWCHDHYYAMALENTKKHAARRTVYRADSCDEKVMEWVADKSLDFVFIDGDHSERGVLRDMNHWFRKVKPGGLFCGHDYGKPDLPGVTSGVDKWFARKTDVLPLSVTKEGNIWWTTRLEM